MISFVRVCASPHGGGAIPSLRPGECGLGEDETVKVRRQDPYTGGPGAWFGGLTQRTTSSTLWKPDAGAQIAPTIKGIFVNSHVAMVRRALGEKGVEELARRLGRPVAFRNSDDVPVREEVRLIEHALDLTSPEPVRQGARSFEAGRLHFQNFLTTPWAKLLFTLFPRNLKFMMLHASTVAERVFKGVRFRSEDLGGNSVRLVMENNDYPLEHFQGLFQEWLEHFGLRGIVEAKVTGPLRYEYVLTWE